MRPSQRANSRRTTQAFLLACASAAVNECLFALPARHGSLISAPRRAAALGLALGFRSKEAFAKSRKKFKTTIAELGLENWKVEDYEAMRDDAPRTSKFADAIRRRAPGATVVDIGTGPFALLAIIAARAGAEKVYAVEKNAAAAKLARKTVTEAGLQSQVQIMEGDSMQIELPERVDLIVSELIGSLATQEGVEPIIRDARKRFLKDSVRCGMIPLRCQTCIAPVYYKGRSGAAKFMVTGDGLRSRGRPVEGSESPLRVKSADEALLRFLAEPQILEDFDYCSNALPGKERKDSKDFEFQLDSGLTYDDRMPPLQSFVNKIAGKGDSVEASRDQYQRFSGFAMWTRVVVDDADIIEVRGQPDSHWAYVIALMSPDSVRVPVPSSISLKSRIDYSASPVRYALEASVESFLK
eukprot:TRINITY_DN7299_c1_g1_i1.p1 TRINITY_DN7299_c1_g1~~TRINITY_DN7299_c1_g1_i1.p1  ORF type:complete len:412 (+),score=84.66 TRINITY_DN7299_c1_g1_i1:121-1356(+)